MVAGVRNNAVEEWIQTVHEERITTLGIYPNYSETVNFERHDHLTAILDTSLASGDCRAHVFMSKKERLHLRNVPWKAMSVTHISRSGMFHGEDAVKGVWRCGEHMSSQSIRDVYFMQKGTALMGAGYAIVDWVSDSMRFPKKLLVSMGLSFHYKRISLYVFMAWVHPMSFKEEDLSSAQPVCTAIFISTLQIWIRIGGSEERELSDTCPRRQIW